MSDQPKTYANPSKHGSVLRLALCLFAGALLASALLVAWSCRTTRSGVVPLTGSASGLDISSAEGAGSRPEPMMRVRIARQIESAQLEGRGPWLIAVEGARTGELLTGPVTISSSAGGIRVADAQGRVRGFGPGTPVYAGPVLRRDDSTGQEIVNIGGIRYPGTLRALPLEDDLNAFDIVNVVEVERYIPGVISKESFPHWDETTFMVQAVAARTYALQRRESARKAGRAYDVDDSTVDQVYGGLTGQRVALRATDATRGVVMTASSKLGEAYYSAVCGGKPALAEELWPKDTAIASVQKVSFTPPAGQANTGLSRGLSRQIFCQSAQWYEWEIARRNDELTKRLQAWGKNRKHDLSKIGPVRSVEIVQRTQTGRSMLVKVTDTKGESVVLSAEQLRTAANYPVDGLRDLTSVARVHSNDFEVRVGTSVTVFKGSGHGHGVGMCQNCAQGMSENGNDWQSILRTFYPQLEITRIY